MSEVSGLRSLPSEPLTEDLLREIAVARSELAHLAQLLVRSWVEATKRKEAIGFSFRKIADLEGGTKEVAVLDPQGYELARLRIAPNWVRLEWVIDSEASEYLFDCATGVLEE